ncbi:hypothetical protein H9P43_009937 [Blastocladiella emersonii ATCC 22665]|nr:hypothetical protein H9P43_009937 [Blastocladiella emersonii ATCC 22665]
MQPRSRQQQKPVPAGHYVKFGTPLARSSGSDSLALDLARPGGARSITPNVPVWKQEVTDEQGRRRLHGAFKGGFSAGYYNTVGSKEGWTPATFTSSRAARSDRKAMRPEDYMDDEDREDAVDGKQLRVAGPKPETSAAAGAAADPIQRLFVPQPAAGGTGGADSLGMRLLRRAGYRDGVLPDALPTRDSAMRGNAGLGFREASNPFGRVVREPAAAAPPTATAAAPLGIRGGIGLGVLNDEDDDDANVYDDVPVAPGADLETAAAAATGLAPLPQLVTQRKKKKAAAAAPAGIVPPELTVCSDGLRAVPGFVVGAKAFTVPPPPVARDVAEAALAASYKPFEGAKRARYLAFCEFYAGQRIVMPTVDDAESVEFAATANLFRPMSTQLEARFTRAHVQVGDATPADSDAEQRVETRTPAEEAAAAGRFGSLTREVVDFFPARLLCKRFGVPVPLNGAAPSARGGERESAVGQLLSADTMAEILRGGSGGMGGMFHASRGLTPPNPAQADDEDPLPPRAQDVLLRVRRPPQEVFDKIFGVATMALAAHLAATASGKPAAASEEDLPQVVVDASAADLPAAAVARIVAQADSGTEPKPKPAVAVPPVAASGNYTRVDERDVAERALAEAGGADAVAVKFKPRFKRKLPVAAAAGTEEEGVVQVPLRPAKKSKSNGSAAAAAAGKRSGARGGAKFAALSFGDDDEM